MRLHARTVLALLVAALMTLLFATPPATADTGTDAPTASSQSSSPQATEDDEAETQIVGGQPASQVYSFMASLQSSRGHFCGGSLIDSDWVVTAAHCVQGAGPGSFNVRVGTTTWNSGGSLAGVSRVILGQGDIALVQLSSNVSQQPVQIADDGGPAGTPTRLIGWGQTCPSRGCGGPPTQLQQIDVRVLASGCTAGFSPATELCLGGQQYRGACYGDSGGPSVIRAGGGWELTGATSRAGRGQPNCGEAPAIYTDVTAYTGWIDQVTGGIGDPSPEPDPEPDPEPEPEPEPDPEPQPPADCDGVAAWSASSSYSPGDTVAHGGSTWESTWWSTGAEPGGPHSHSTWTNTGSC